MTKEPKWLSKTAVLAIHDRLLAEHGGATGIRDEGLLDAALASPRNRLLYDRLDIIEVAAAYAHALTRNHAFNDGNKRLALTVMGVFLELNGVRLVAAEREAVTAIVALSSRKMEEGAFVNWLRASCETLSRPRGTKPSRPSGRSPRRRPPKK